MKAISVFACKTCLHAAFFKLHINAVISTQNQYKRKVAPRKLQHTPKTPGGIPKASTRNKNTFTNLWRLRVWGMFQFFFFEKSSNVPIFLFALHWSRVIWPQLARPLGIDFSRGLPLTCKRLKPGMQGDRNEASWAIKAGGKLGEFFVMKMMGFWWLSFNSLTLNRLVDLWILTKTITRWFKVTSLNLSKRSQKIIPKRAQRIARHSCFHWLLFFED